MLFQCFTNNIIPKRIGSCHGRNRDSGPVFPGEIKEIDNIKLVIVGDADDRNFRCGVIYGRIIRHRVKSKRIGEPFPNFRLIGGIFFPYYADGFIQVQG